MTDQEHYRHMWRHSLVRMLLMYLAPLLLLVGAFYFQYRDLAHESRRRHLMSIAENQASTLELFLRERVVNLTNLIDDPMLPHQPSAATAQANLARLQRESGAFVDLGFFDNDGQMLTYSGPYPSLLDRTYGTEDWFVKLVECTDRFVITDMYLGFRQSPHFTIAVKRSAGDGPYAVRATLDPDRLSRYITTLKGSGEVHSVLVNSAGKYQTVNLPDVLAHGASVLIPSHHPPIGVDILKTANAQTDYAYCWLGLTDWALIVLFTGSEHGSTQAGLSISLLAISTAVILALFSTIVIRAGQVVRTQKKEDRARKDLSGQLRHAARLASVGELAAGVAHEINNPLAIIAEEAGLMRDMLDPAFGQKLSEAEILSQLDTIHEAVFRARDITRQLLSFVRKEDVRLIRVNLNDVLESVVGGLLEREMAVSNISIVRDYDAEIPDVLADRGQIEQVVLNLVTNAIDAMPNGGRLELCTSASENWVRIAVSDTGVGIAPEHMEKIFMPFHTTKEVGKGTGLGLSVSSGIIEGHGGEIIVESSIGSGSTFTVTLPVEPVDDTPTEED